MKSQTVGRPRKFKKNRRLLQAMRNKMITGKALAKAVRVTENTITNALAGKAILHSNASRISMILNMEIKDIFDVVSISGDLHWLN